MSADVAEYDVSMTDHTTVVLAASRTKWPD